ncbi:MAG: putative metallopeptidase [Nanoarchaeota archaeon]
MKYELAPDIQAKTQEISKILFPHVRLDFVKCFRSYGTSSRGTIARCHGLGKLMQKALGFKAFYVLEFISERFDKLPEEEKIKVIIHELMHIPFSFGGGFKHHDHVTERNINKHYSIYKKIKETGGFLISNFQEDNKKSEIKYGKKENENKEKGNWFLL